MADIKDNIIGNKNINIGSLSDAPIAASAREQAGPDFDIAQAKASGDLNAELFARFQKFGRDIHAASGGRDFGRPGEAFSAGAAVHAAGGPAKVAENSAPRPRFLPGTGPATGANMGYGGFGPDFGPSAGCGPKGKGPNPMNLREHGFGGPLGRGRVLVALSMRDGIPQKDLAFILGIRPQSLSELVGKLEADGYVTRTRSDADRRAVAVSLTEAGKAEAAKIQAKRNLSADTMFEKLTEEEKRTLQALLEKLQS